MKFAWIIGLPLSIIGLILYSPPVLEWLTPIWGESGRLGTLITFAVGWALLFGYLVFNLGMQSQIDRQ